MTSADWSDMGARAIALYLDGSDAPDRAEDGTPLLDDDFLVLVNAWWEPLEFVLPVTEDHVAWRLEVDTYDPAASGRSAAPALDAGQHRHRRPPVRRRAIQPAKSLTALIGAGPGVSPGPAPSRRTGSFSCPGAVTGTRPSPAPRPRFPAHKPQKLLFSNLQVSKGHIRANGQVHR